MAKIEKYVCDTCKTYIDCECTNQRRLQLFHFGHSIGREPTADEVKIMNAIPTGATLDFCSLRCLYNWATAKTHGI